MSTEYEGLDEQDQFGYIFSYVVVDDNSAVPHCVFGDISAKNRVIVGEYRTLANARAAMSGLGPNACIYTRTLNLDMQR